MTTAATRIWTFAAVIIVIVVIALGWFLGAAPKLAEAARFDEERRSTEAQNDAARVIIAQLEADFAQIDVLKAELEELRGQFPSMPEYDDAIEELLDGIDRESVGIESIVVAAPAPDSPDAVIDESGQVAAGTLMRIPITINIRGEFPQALRLIERMQLSDRFSIVLSADYVEGRSDDRATVIQLVLLVLTDAPVALDVPPTEGEPQPEPTPSDEPSESPDPEATDPAAVDPSADPTPSP